MLNKKVTHYQTIFRDFGHKLDEEVNALIKAGWQPLGGPVYGPGAQIRQAMVKYESPWWASGGTTNSFGPG